MLCPEKLYMFAVMVYYCPIETISLKSFPRYTEFIFPYLTGQYDCKYGSKKKDYEVGKFLKCTISGFLRYEW